MTTFSDGAVVGLCYGKMGREEGREERVGGKGAKREGERENSRYDGILGWCCGGSMLW